MQILIRHPFLLAFPSYWKTWKTWLHQSFGKKEAEYDLQSPTSEAACFESLTCLIHFQDPLLVASELVLHAAMAKSISSRCVFGNHAPLTVSLRKVSNTLPPIANIVQFSSWHIHDNENAFAESCLLRRDRMVANEPALYPILTIFVSIFSIIQPKPFYF